MTRKSPRNLAASVRQRLLGRARSDQRPFNELLQYYAMERFLYRLSRSRHADRFVLKGALMLRAWQSPEVRATMDIDLLGRTTNEQAALINQVRDILAISVEPDGLIFDSDSIRAENITENAEYAGVRILFRGALDSAKLNMQIDIGFGDLVFPEPEQTALPVMLDSPAPRLLCYSRESAIAEKFQAMVKLGDLNSRMKDFYDIWLLSRQFDFDGRRLAEAVRLTFERRRTALPASPVIFTKAFADAKQMQWTAFRRRLQQEHVPASFADITTAIKRFLGPLAGSEPSFVIWKAPGLWLDVKEDSDT